MMRSLIVILIMLGSSSMANALSAISAVYRMCRFLRYGCIDIQGNREGITEKALEFQGASERLTQPVIDSLGFDAFGQHFNKIGERVGSDWQPHDDSFEVKEAEYRTTSRKVLATLR